MRRIVLAALLAAVALPAWAANDGKPQPYTGPVYPLTSPLTWDAIKVCEKAGGDGIICYMHHATEENALWMARFMLDGCREGDTRPAAIAQCAAVQAYIKQRWGY